MGMDKWQVDNIIGKHENVSWTVEAFNFYQFECKEQFPVEVIFDHWCNHNPQEMSISKKYI